MSIRDQQRSYFKDNFRAYNFPTYIIYLTLLALALFVCNEALAVDLNKAAKAATDPLIAAVNDHWGKVVALAGAVSAGLGEGDLRTRAIRAAIGSGAASAAVLGIMASIA